MSVSRISVLASIGILCAAWGSSSSAGAQEVRPGTTNTQEQSQLDPLLKPAHRKIESPERFMLELKGGPYRVFSGTPYDVFANDSGPTFGAQLEGILFRLPRVLYVTAGGGVGYAGYDAKALNERMEEATEETTLSLVPMNVAASVRVDVLPRRLGIPVIFAARVGWRWTHWDTNTGKLDDAAGWSIGPMFTGQVALDLDSFEPGGARALDEEWGINHTFLLGEVTHYATTDKSLPVGGTTWSIGLGVAF
ncbi:MAG TPA: MXAN_2562 family outer membrane beta-barrel protein [Polyangiales bacterium]|jgi:hypothetical protein|nr:MXAN_2562 family outer membrane beta-barrel protein [Polyangiales bacterium]